MATLNYQSVDHGLPTISKHLTLLCSFDTFCHGSCSSSSMKSSPSAASSTAGGSSWTAPKMTSSSLRRTRAETVTAKPGENAGN